jgi:hypothetical protein
VLTQNRERLYRQLLARLLAAYRRKADLLRAERVASFEKLRSDALDKAYEKVSDQYVKYANAKGPLVVKVAILSGFPDPDPGSLRAPSATDFAALRRFQAAKEVRSVIKKLDQDFRASMSATLKESNEMTDAQIAGLLAELEGQLAKIEENTRALAAQELGKTQKELRPLLGDQKPMVLAAEPTRTLQFQAATLHQPKVPAPVVSSQVVAEPQKELEAQLRVWLRVNRYVLGRKGTARDATREFLAWRKSFNPSPVPNP